MAVKSICSLRRSATSKFLKPLLRFLSQRRSDKADAEARAQNEANEALEAALLARLRFHAAPDADVALGCSSTVHHSSSRPQCAEVQRSPSSLSVPHADDAWLHY